MTEPQRQQIFWNYATVFGAIWGAIEITVGSFLHTIRVPFASTAVVLLGLSILVYQRGLAPMRGITIATGVVAAVCKSLSPNGIIVGPMLGIVVEALLVELVFSTIGRHVVGAMVAGLLAALWPLGQGLVMQWLYMGATVIELYQTLLAKTGTGGLGALVAILGIIGGLGVAAGLMTHRLGVRIQRARELLGAAGPTPPEPLDEGTTAATGAHRSPAPGPTLLDITPTAPVTQRGGTRRLGIPFALVALVTAGLLWQGRILLALGGAAVWILYLLVRDRGTIASKPLAKFMIFAVPLALMSGLLLGKTDGHLLGVPYSLDGLEAGGLMLTRGLVIFTMLRHASGAANLGAITKTLGRIGLAPLGEAITGALSYLPGFARSIKAVVSPSAAAASLPSGLVARWRTLLMELATFVEDLHGPATAASPVAPRVDPGSGGGDASHP